MLTILIALQAATSQPAVVPAAVPAHPKVVCRNEIALGSRIARRRVCATPREWDERSRVDKETITRMQANTVPNH